MLVVFPNVLTENEVFTWGKSSRGRLGRSPECNHLPNIVALPKEDQFSVVSLSSSHSSTLIAVQRKIFVDMLM